MRPGNAGENRGTPTSPDGERAPGLGFREGRPERGVWVCILGGPGGSGMVSCGLLPADDIVPLHIVFLRLGDAVDKQSGGKKV